MKARAVQNLAVHYRGGISIGGQTFPEPARQLTNAPLHPKIAGVITGQMGSRVVSNYAD
jgi:hypothetical protein